MTDVFSSGFASRLNEMLVFKQSIGYSVNSHLPQAKSFDQYCSTYYPEVNNLTKELALAWVEGSKQISSGFHGRATFIRGFGKYLIAMGENAYIVPDKYYGGKTTFVPYIFTDEELAALFQEIDHFQSKDLFQPLLLSTIFRLIYTCGLRPNEGRNLKRGAVNLLTGEILITETKKRKERIVIMSDDMLSLAKSYARVRDVAFPDSLYFFSNRNGQPYSAEWLQTKFKGFFASANPMIDPDLLPPVRVYDLRHRFASAALNRWLDEKKDLYSKLPYLRTYMGHRELSATAYYIHILPENLIKSSGIDWSKLHGIIPEVELWEE